MFSSRRILTSRLLQLQPSLSSLFPAKPNSNSFSFIIGNTRLLWPQFMEYLRNQSPIGDNPFDTFIQDKITEISLRFHPHPVHIHYSHVKYNEQYIPIQRLAHECFQMAYFDPVSHLSIHPEYGPWFALRALMTVECDETYNNDEIIVHDFIESPLNNPLNIEQQKTVKSMMGKLLLGNAGWQQWVEMRDLLSTDKQRKEWRYCQDQLEYHYTKNKEILVKQLSSK